MLKLIQNYINPIRFAVRLKFVNTNVLPATHFKSLLKILPQRGLKIHNSTISFFSMLKILPERVLKTCPISNQLHEIHIEIIPNTGLKKCPLLHPLSVHVEDPGRKRFENLS
jgi:hypothetical protein